MPYESKVAANQAREQQQRIKASESASKADKPKKHKTSEPMPPFTDLAAVNVYFAEQMHVKAKI